jgi:hypothetical protein
VSSYAGRSRKYKKKQAKRSKIGKWEDWIIIIALRGKDRNSSEA